MAKGALRIDEFMGRKSFFQKLSERVMPWVKPDNVTGKPVADIQYTGAEPKVQYPRLAMPLWACFETIHMCGPARTIINHLISETFRNRGKWKPRFEVKCLVCGLEMKSYPKNGLCQRKSCKSTVMVARDEAGVFGYAPDDDELAFFNHGRPGASWGGISKVNNAGMSLWQLMLQLAFDLCVTDDCYLICVKEHKRRGDGTIFAEPQELVRGHPNVMRIVSDDYGNRGGLVSQCPIHRSKIVRSPSVGIRAHSGNQGDGKTSDLNSYEGWNSNAVKDENNGLCDVFDSGIGSACGIPLKPVHFVATDSGGAAPKQYYFEDEVIHRSFFSPGVLYGMPPVLTLYREMRSLIKMMEYIQTYFEKRRIPRGIIAVNTPRKEAVKVFKQELNREADDNQQDIPVMAVEGTNQRGWIEFIPFADKLSEMDMQALRDECRMTIGAFYGVAPVFMGDTAQGGGLNNEGLQITVMNRSVEGFQRLWNEELFPWVAKQFGITDHEFVLEPSEEKDIAHEYQLELLRQQVAAGKMTQFGLRFLGIGESGEYRTEDKPSPLHPAMAAFDGMAVDPAGQGAPQPGGQQAKPVNSDNKGSIQEDLEDEPDGAPSETDGKGKKEDMF